MTEQYPQPTPAGSPAERLRGVVVRVRADLEVTRHVFQGEPCYVVRDPVTFATQRISVEDYLLLVALDRDQPLGETFTQLVESEDLLEEDEDAFYSFVMGLHRVGLLALPVGDHRALYTRYERRQRAARFSRIMSPLFLRVPLWNPDGFLNRTIGALRWMYTPAGFLLWVCLMVAAGAVAFVRKDELSAPLLTILELENLPLLWVILIGLKTFHEFGHAYACKAFGGQVPEMGAFFIMGTPCAYVDATAAWGFGSMRRRMVVNLGGMYFESFFAVLGLFVWAGTSPGLLNTAAYQVALMASIVTIGFNINPLAKFDGYYILSDFVGIPNLRQHAATELKSLLSGVTLGVPTPPSPFGPVTRIGVLVFGIASACYRTTVVIGLSAVLASKLFLVGLFIAIGYIGLTLFGLGLKLARYMWWSPETANVRFRAIAVSSIAIVGTVLGVGVIPINKPVKLIGTIATEQEATLFAPRAARVEDLPTARGDRVEPGATIVRLGHPDLALEAVEADTALRILETELDMRATTDYAEAKRIEARIPHAELASERARARLDELTIASPIQGQILELAPQLEPGHFVQAGDPLARVGSGDWVVKLLMDEDAITKASPEIGDEVQCRSAVDPSTTLMGEVISIAPVGTRHISHSSVTQVAGGPITINPESNRAGKPYFELVVRLRSNDTLIPNGATVHARIGAAPETIAHAFVDHLRRFAAALETN